MKEREINEVNVWVSYVEVSKIIHIPSIWLRDLLFKFKINIYLYLFILSITNKINPQFWSRGSDRQVPKLNDPGEKRNDDYSLVLLLVGKAVGEINIAGLPDRKSLRTWRTK